MSQYDCQGAIRGYCLIEGLGFSVLGEGSRVYRVGFRGLQGLGFRVRLAMGVASLRPKTKTLNPKPKQSPCFD